MKKNFSFGDILIFLGTFIYFIFVLTLFINYIDDHKFNWVAGGQLVLLLMTGIPILFTVLSLKNKSWLKINYAFCIYIALLKIGNVSTVSELAAVGIDFFILFSALIIGIGVYLSENFPSLIIAFQQEKETFKSVLKEESKEKSEIASDTQPEEKK